MNFHKNKYLTTVAAAALALAVGACGSGSDDDDMMSGGPPPVIDPEAPGPETPPPLSELASAQADAAAAALAAMTASGEAATAAEAAMAAVANFATMQTNATARGLAYEAHSAAGKAMAAYLLAKEASEAAAESEEVTAAVEARIMAEAAMADAVKYATTASEKGTAAETAAIAELMIDGKDKNVGGTSVNADDPARTESLNDQSTITGRIKDGDPMHTDNEAKDANGVAVPMVAVVGVELVGDTEHVQAVAVHEFSIGRTLDTSDDMARLMLVTHYAGSKSVKVYAGETGDVLEVTRASDGTLTLVSDADAVVTLKSVGRYYLAGEADADDGLSHADLVADGAKAKEVFAYVENDVTAYVVLDTTTVGDDDDIVHYKRVDITVVGVPEEDNTATTMEVSVSIPEATEYKHIHFGVWAALGVAEKDGSQELSDRGIGFVQNYSGGGLTSIGGTSDDMPNGGDATYNGNWVAAVQGADEDGNGDITLLNNAATLTAKFGMGDITAELTGLATLTGKITGNTFEGSKAKLAASPMGGLTAADFTGSFSGGFYGAKAVEAGGIFDFTSEDAENGAFRGAFGGKK